MIRDNDSHFTDVFRLRNRGSADSVGSPGRRLATFEQSRRLIELILSRSAHMDASRFCRRPANDSLDPDADIARLKSEIPVLECCPGAISIRHHERRQNVRLEPNIFNSVDSLAPDDLESWAAFADGQGYRWAHRKKPVESVAAIDVVLQSSCLPKPTCRFRR